MKKNLVSIFPSYRLLSELPEDKINNNVYTFKLPNEQWFQVNKSEVSERDYALLSSLYTEASITFSTDDSVSGRWLQYLRGVGAPPIKEGTEIRIIQLEISDEKFQQPDLTKAVHMFFEDAMQLVYVSNHRILLIEQKSTYIQTADDFASFLVALESDFFIKGKIYIGKFHPINLKRPAIYTSEKEWFTQGLALQHAERIYTLESTFPILLTKQMSENLKQMIVQEILLPTEFDLELLHTVQAFFENGFNASITSKKLHIHRNTLNYRLTKFQEITGVSIRNFDGALIAYCASLLAKLS